jgi:hypothetical protein
MARVREWHTALRTAIEHGVPINDVWLGAYRAQARESLRLASLAIATDSDRSAYPFLVNAYNNMRNLSDQYLQITNNRDYIDSNSLQKRSPESEICHVRPLPVLHGFHQSIHRRRLSPMRD